VQPHGIASTIVLSKVEFALFTSFASFAFAAVISLMCKTG
jgi:hypothetical protein